MRSTSQPVPEPGHPERPPTLGVDSLLHLLPALAVTLESASRSVSAPFFGGDGVAVAPQGTIYVDTAPLATLTPFAVLELSPAGTAHVLWEAQT